MDTTSAKIELCASTKCALSLTNHKCIVQAKQKEGKKDRLPSIVYLIHVYIKYLIGYHYTFQPAYPPTHPLPR